MNLLQAAKKTYSRLRVRRHVDLVKFLALSARQSVPMWPTDLGTTQLANFKRVLVLAPHPDDEVFGMGGAIIKLLRQKSQVHFMWLTNGHNEVRKAESQAVMSTLGLSQSVEKAFPLKTDSVGVNEAAAAIGAAIAEFGPDLICVPSVLDPHYDHVRVGTALERAAKASNWQGWVLQYEVWGTLSPNVLLDVSDAMQEKESLMRMYVSQLDEPNRKYVERIIALNMYRGLTHQVDYAEAFVLLQMAEFRRLFDA